MSVTYLGTSLTGTTNIIRIWFYFQGEIPKQPQKTANPGSGGIDWSVNPTEKAKYDQLFDSLQPTNGLIPGNKVC